MQQRKVLNTFKTLLQELESIQSAMIIGSFSRNQATMLSDINLQLLIEPDFILKHLKHKIHEHFATDVKRTLWLDNDKKLIVYLYAEYLRVEIGFSEHIDGLAQHFLNSEIKNIHQCVIFDRSSILKKHLQQLLLEKKTTRQFSYDFNIKELINVFLFQFERCSFSHKRIDEYKFYFYYHSALHTVVRLKHLAQKGTKFNYLPPNFCERYLNKRQKSDFKKLCSPKDFMDANATKRALLDFFCETLRKLDRNYLHLEIDISPIQEFCENIFNRDFLLNFRDISCYNPKIKPGRIYRSHELTFYKDQEEILRRLKHYRINTIIDLSTHDERKEKSYQKDFINNFNYAHLPIDPKNQMSTERLEYQNGSDNENVYRFFALECKSQIKKMIEYILNDFNHGVLIHCVAGKDRTGAMIALLYLVVGTPRKIIQDDFLASGGNMSLKKINAFLKIIEQHKGIKNYLNTCGVLDTQYYKMVKHFSI